MNDLIIRRAVPADLDQLYEFEQAVIAAERPFDPTLKKEKIHYYDMEQLMHEPHIELAVAELNQQLVGSGYARIEQAKPYLRHERHAYLGFMYVIPEFRRRGINKKVIEHLKKWAVSKQITELRLDVYANNHPAIQAYEHDGFSKHLIEMRMELTRS